VTLIISKRIYDIPSNRANVTPPTRASLFYFMLHAAVAQVAVPKVVKIVEF